MRRHYDCWFCIVVAPHYTQVACYLVKHPPFISEDLLVRDECGHGNIVSPFKRCLQAVSCPEHVVSHRRQDYLLETNRLRQKMI